MATIHRNPLVVSKTDRREAYPVDLRTIAFASTLTLLIAAVPPPTVHAQTDLSPQTTTYPVDLRTWTQNLQQTTLFVAPLTPPVGESTTDLSPRTTVYPADLRTYTQTLITAELYIPPPPQPLALADTPRGASYPHSAFATVAPSPLTLRPVAATEPVGGSAAPVPDRAPYPVDLRTTISTTLNAETGFQAYLFRPTNVAPQGVNPWPVSLLTWTQNLLQTTLAPSLSVPFNQSDWPARVDPIYPATLRTSIAFFVEDTNTPPQPADTSTPRGAIYPIGLRTWTYNPLAILSSPFPVARQTDWPTPIAAGYPAHLRTLALDLQQATLAPVTASPVGDTVTELPRGAIYPNANRTLTVDLQQSTLFSAPPVPTSQHDWPTPRGTVYPPDLRTGLHATDLRLKDTFFGAPGQPVPQHDWPTPRGPIYPNSLRTFIHVSQITVAPGLVRRTLYLTAGSRNEELN